MAQEFLAAGLYQPAMASLRRGRRMKEYLLVSAIELLLFFFFFHSSSLFFMLKLEILSI